MAAVTTEETEDRVEQLLRVAVSGAPPRLGRALEHAVFPGGARVRPRLCIAVANAVGLASDATYACACAIELLHCASLVHDDLPCFDDAATRRGRPSVHRAFGEATAVLAGDALIVAAFEQVASQPVAVRILARAAGATEGLVGGQAAELEPGPVDVAAYHAAKTGALFAAAAELGAFTGGGRAESFAPLGRAFGAMWQIADDAADAFGSAAVLGKPVGRDAVLHRPTAASSRDAAVLRFEAAV
jgi:geranylgeranyl diphosphate synthase type II